MAADDDVRDLVGVDSEAGGGVPCAAPAHERFAQALALHGNRTAAYRQAYPDATAATANSHSSALSRHADVQRRVLDLRAARRKKLLEATADLEALVANLCRGKAADLLDEEGNLIPPHLLPREVRDAIKSIKIRVITTRDGDTVREFDYQLPDPLLSIKLLAQLRGSLVERHDLTSAGRSLQPAVDPRDLPALDAELRKRLIPPDDGADLIG